MEELEQPEIQGSKEEFGKFKDAESLLKAYSNLEAEFTKKSQKLASLEEQTLKKEKESSREAQINKEIEDFVNKFDAVRPFGSALKESLTKDENANLYEVAFGLLNNNYKSAENYAKDSEFLNNYIFSNAEIKDKIVKEYLSNVTQTTPIKVNSSASSISLTPPRVPTTIGEAGRMAKTIIKQK